MATTRGNSSIRWSTSHRIGRLNATSKASGPVVLSLNSQVVIDAVNSYALNY
jgi:hypothetical protein